MWPTSSKSEMRAQEREAPGDRVGCSWSHWSNRSTGSKHQVLIDVCAGLPHPDYTLVSWGAGRKQRGGATELKNCPNQRVSTAFYIVFLLRIAARTGHTVGALHSISSGHALTSTTMRAAHRAMQNLRSHLDCLL